jgi:peptide-methionine (S)-S-oxide reductase
LSQLTIFMENLSVSTNPSSGSETITLGGGCFWCTESVYVAVKGVLDVESGYSNGESINPTYEQVCSGHTGHNEVVKLVYDPATISTREVLEIFFVIHDPTTLNRQGNDQGTQYRSGIYYSTPEQKQIANDIIAELTASKHYSSPIVTEVLPLTNYSAAEDYHQDYFARNPTQGYCMAVAAPKVAKFRKTFARLAKA